MEKAQRRLMEEHDILTALDNHQFAIWLQPQVDAASGEVCGAEVLLRQRQPDGSWSLPTDLIERIEACGLMVPVGYWVMEEACRQLAAWQSLGIMLPLSVNVSLLQLLHHDRGTEMLTLLDRYRIAPGTLVLEITESRHLDDPQTVVSLLRPLREAGVRIALDDFGMGYAGLRQLQHMKSLPVDILKIDKAFIDMLPRIPAWFRRLSSWHAALICASWRKELKKKRSITGCRRPVWMLFRGSCLVALCRRRPL